MLDLPEDKRLGEVVQSTSTHFIAQSFVLHDVPPLGSLVRARSGELTVYGIVQFASTTSIDAGRRPIARGAQFADEQDVYTENPQLERLLRTDFEALVVGFRRGSEICHHLPPQPVRVHAFVYQCNGAEVRAFTERWDFLSLIASGDVSVATDELLAACVREAAQARAGDRAFLIEAGRQLARIVGPDTARLTAILKRVRPAAQRTPVSLGER